MKTLSPGLLWFCTLIQSFSLNEGVGQTISSMIERQTVRSEATNGIFAEVSVFNPLKTGRAEVWVYLQPTVRPHDNDTNWTTYFFQRDPAKHYPQTSTNRPNEYPRNVSYFFWYEDLMRATYFQALNSACGMVELFDENGRTIPMLKPELNETNRYPTSFRFTKLGDYEFAPQLGAMHSGPPWPAPVLNASKLPNIVIDQVFAIPKAGNYMLKVSPIVYCRSTSDPDLCNRVDLPPITIPVRWEH